MDSKRQFKRVFAGACFHYRQWCHINCSVAEFLTYVFDWISLLGNKLTVCFKNGYSVILPVHNTTFSNCEHVFHFHNVCDDNVVSNSASVNCSRPTNMYVDFDYTLDHAFESFQYTDYSTCDYDKDLDPANNLCNRVLPSCKYYDDLQFNVLKKNNTNGLSIIHLNARSLNANFHSII